MSRQVQLRRGDLSQHASFTGASGEVTVNTTNWTLHVHNGQNAGGISLARADLSNISITGKNIVSNMSKPSSQYVELTLGPTGSLFVSPASGYAMLAVMGCEMLQMYNESAANFWSTVANQKNNPSCVWLPCKKGDVIRYYYTSITERWLRVYSDYLEI